MYIAILTDNMADRKQMERLLGRANDVLAAETGTLYIDAYGDIESLMRAPMKYELFFIDISVAEDHGRIAIERLQQFHVTGMIVVCQPQDTPFSYQDAIDGIYSIAKPVATAPLHQIIRDAHRLFLQHVVPQIEIRTETDTHYVPLDKILYAQCRLHIVYIYLDDHTTLSMLGEINDFYRWVSTHHEFTYIKKDTVVNQNHVVSQTKRECQLSSGETLSIPHFPFLH